MEPKDKWPAGPWHEEPDDLTWEHSGLACHMRRNHGGAWCGYVGIPEGHPLHGKDDGAECPELAEALEKLKGEPLGPNPSFAVMLACISGDIKASPDVVFRVHGGLTYSRNHCPMLTPDGRWWFGFDCSHSGDLSPANLNWQHEHGFDDHHGGDAYRRFDYAKAQTESLASQLAAVGGAQ